MLMVWDDSGVWHWVAMISRLLLMVMLPPESMIHLGNVFIVVHHV